MIDEPCDKCGKNTYLNPVWDKADNPIHLCPKCIIEDDTITYDENNCFYFITEEDL